MADGEGVRILGPNGQPMARPKPKGLAGNNSRIPYDAANFYGDHMGDWQPYLWSPDGELNPYRDTIVSRVRDVVRNDGWGSGAITRILDNAIGANYRPLLKPDWKALQAYTGNPGFNLEWAYAYRTAGEAVYRTWSKDPGRYCDTQRAMLVPQMMRLGFRHKIVDGDALGILQWLPGRMGFGRARYATALQMIDPDRLSNPQMRYDSHTLRGGVEVDDWGAALAYHIRRAHQGDWWSAGDSVKWDRVLRETPDGRPIVVHDFDHDRAGQHRGGAGVLTPVLQRLKMLIRYDGAELDAAIVNAIFAAFIESPFDKDLVDEALSDEDGRLSAYQNLRQDFHEGKRLKLPSGPNMTMLAPGETIGQVAATRPSGNFADFEKAVLRNVASAAGLSAQQVSNDWSDVNYSSARGAMLEFWKTMARRRDDYAAGFPQPILGALLEEAMEYGELPLPPGAPEYAECRAAYGHAVWVGPGRGWIDPVNEVKGAVLGMDAAVTSFDRVCIEQGEDPDEMVEARVHDIKRFTDAGIPVPTWAGLNPNGEPAQKTIDDPKAV